MCIRCCTAHLLCCRTCCCAQCAVKPLLALAASSLLWYADTLGPLHTCIGWSTNQPLEVWKGTKAVCGDSALGWPGLEKQASWRRHYPGFAMTQAPALPWHCQCAGCTMLHWRQTSSAEIALFTLSNHAVLLYTEFLRDLGGGARGFLPRLLCVASLHHAYTLQGPISPRRSRSPAASARPRGHVRPGQVRARTGVGLASPG